MRSAVALARYFVSHAQLACEGSRGRAQPPRVLRLRGGGRQGTRHRQTIGAVRRQSGDPRTERTIGTTAATTPGILSLRPVCPLRPSPRAPFSASGYGLSGLLTPRSRPRHPATSGPSRPRGGGGRRS
jgi:hypothetical protein